MSTSVTLSNFVALAFSATLAAAQITGAPSASAPLATYPATVLAKKGPFAYPDGIVCILTFLKFRVLMFLKTL